MKKYFVKYGDFGNVYSLRWAEDGDAIPAGYEQITRKKAEQLARAERRRRKDEPMSSGYADSYIFPFTPDGLSPHEADVFSGALNEATWEPGCMVVEMPKKWRR